MIDEEDEEMMHQAISRSLLRAEREKSTKINVTLPIDATTEAIIEEDGVDNSSSSSSSTHGLSANNLVDEEDGAVDNVSIDGMGRIWQCDHRQWQDMAMRSPTLAGYGNAITDSCRI